MYQYVYIDDRRSSLFISRQDNHVLFMQHNQCKSTHVFVRHRFPFRFASFKSSVALYTHGQHLDMKDYNYVMRILLRTMILNSILDRVKHLNVFDVRVLVSFFCFGMCHVCTSLLSLFGYYYNY